MTELQSSIALPACRKGLTARQAVCRHERNGSDGFSTKLLKSLVSAEGPKLSTPCRVTGKGTMTDGDGKLIRRRYSGEVYKQKLEGGDPEAIAKRLTMNIYRGTADRDEPLRNLALSL
jgi:hypothetical protein